WGRLLARMRRNRRGPVKLKKFFTASWINSGGAFPSATEKKLFRFLDFKSQLAEKKGKSVATPYFVPFSFRLPRPEVLRKFGQIQKNTVGDVLLDRGNAEGAGAGSTSELDFGHSMRRVKFNEVPEKVPEKACFVYNFRRRRLLQKVLVAHRYHLTKLEQLQRKVMDETRQSSLVSLVVGQWIYNNKARKFLHVAR
ncbi:unnamed protein product, partial [Cladocopium goreaui]